MSIIVTPELMSLGRSAATRRGFGDCRFHDLHLKHNWRGETAMDCWGCDGRISVRWDDLPPSTTVGEIERLLRELANEKADA